MILLFNNLSIENSDSYFKCAISGHRKESQKTKWYMVVNVRLDFFIAPKASAEGACILSKMGYY